MTPVSRIKQFAMKVGEARRWRQTTIAVARLPVHMRRDVGWGG